MTSSALAFPRWPRRVLPLLGAVLALMAGRASPAGATHRIDRVVMGRITYAAGATSFGIFEKYLAPNAAAPAGDVLQSSFGLEHGVTDRLTVGVVVNSRTQRRDRFEVDRVGIQGTFRALDRPAQFGAGVTILPSTRGEPVAGEFLLSALKNVGAWAFSVTHSIEAEKEPGAEYEFEHEIEPAIFHHFGVHGLIGMELELMPQTGASMLDLVIGGTVNKNVFISFEPKFATNRRADDFELRVQVQFYRGPYSLGSWGLQ